MDELDQALAQIAEAMAVVRDLPTLSPQTNFTEIDEDRTVEVVVDEDGKVTSIKVLQNWEDRISADMLADRINMTLGKAELRIVGVNPDGDDSATQIDPAEVELIDPRTPQDIVITQEDRHAAEEQADRSYDAFMARVEQTSKNREAVWEDIQRKFDELDEVLAEDEAPVDERYFSENRMVSIAGNGSMLGNVEITESWLASPRSALTITQALSEALAQVPQDGIRPNDLLGIFK